MENYGEKNMSYYLLKRNELFFLGEHYGLGALNNKHFDTVYEIFGFLKPILTNTYQDEEIKKLAISIYKFTQGQDKYNVVLDEDYITVNISGELYDLLRDGIIHITSNYEVRSEAEFREYWRYDKDVIVYKICRPLQPEEVETMKSQNGNIYNTSDGIYVDKLIQSLITSIEEVYCDGKPLGVKLR